MSRKPAPTRKKKLDLDKRTLRALTLPERELGQVAGGGQSRTRPTTI